MDNENLGKDVREFFRGFLDEKSDYVEGDSNLGRYSTKHNIQANNSNESYTYNRQMTQTGLSLECNQAATLKEGNLLLVFQERCYQVDPKTKNIEYCFQLHRSPESYFWTALPSNDGSVYCTVSGSTTDEEPIRVASFGKFGAILRVNHIKGSLEVVLEKEVVDPFGMEFLNENVIIVCDFGSWDKGGKVIAVDVRTNAYEILAENGEFVSPMFATMDENGVLWVANAMHREYDGSIVRVDPGNKQSTVYPRQGPGSGILSCLFPSNNNDKLLFVVIDWPFMAKSSLCSFDKQSGKVEVLLGASDDNPKLYCMRGALDGDVVWIAESYNNELLGFDLNESKIIEIIDITGITGRRKGYGIKGVFDSFDFIETVAMVPPQKM